jgi:hypothetical protein
LAAPFRRGGFLCALLRDISDAQQKKPPLHVVEIDPGGGFVEGVVIARIPGVGDSRQERVPSSERVQSFSQVNRK